MDDQLLQLYFEGKTSERQTKIVTEWLNKDENNMKYYLRLCRLYEISIWNEIPQTKRSIPFKKLSLNFIKIAAIFILAFLISNLYNSQEENLMQTIRVPLGQNVQLTLSDGSKVWLNAGSTLQFPSLFTDNKRKVFLDGEGYFEVQSNKKKPFIVSTHRYDVKALGTSFNVIAYNKSKDFETSLLSGKVEITQLASQSTINLTPNQKAYSDHGNLKISEVINKDYFLWREGIIYFNDPLETVFKKLELYFDVHINIENKNILNNQSRCVGKFRSRDGLDHILSVLKVNNNFTYSKDNEKNQITIK